MNHELNNHKMVKMNKGEKLAVQQGGIPSMNGVWQGMNVFEFKLKDNLKILLDIKEIKLFQGE